MLKTNMSQKGKVVALFVVLTFAVAGLVAIIFLSESFVVVAQQAPEMTQIIVSSQTLQ